MVRIPTLISYKKKCINCLIIFLGHNFWDTEIWMFPVILLLRPDLAEILLQYRASKKIAAKDLAAEIGCRGIR